MQRSKSFLCAVFAVALIFTTTACEADTTAANAGEASPTPAATPATNDDAGEASAAPEATSTKSEAQSALETIDAFIESENIDKTNPSWRISVQRPPQATFDSSKTYFWILETNHGQMKIKLLADTAPMHASSTIYLTKLGFYDGLSFHRVISDFMAQGGDPLGNGRGGPGYKYDGEFDPSVKHDAPGKLSMANAGPGTDGSQFFLTFVETPHLDGKHTVFGEVTEGMATLRELESRGSRSGTPSEPMEITRATIVVE
jgi:peptidyl-prolyl cis-trans isomerase B (cyclophilin B)